MSIVTLKRKSQAKYNNISVGQPQFNINGVTRLQGYVGQNLISRSFPKTLKRGDAARGFGGCCGTYSNKEVLPQDIWTTEDSKTVKSSVVNNSGMIATKYMWTLRPKPFSSWKPDSNQPNSSSNYTTFLSKKAIDDKVIPKIFKKSCDGTQCILTKKALPTVDQSEYIARLGNKCYNKDICKNGFYVAKGTSEAPSFC